MIHLEDTLRAEHVVLGLPAETAEEAGRKLAALLRDDERILEWQTFHEALRQRSPCLVVDDADFGMCIVHARTSALSSMVLAAARLRVDTVFAECARPVRYVFCLGVPQEMAADYLRIAGLLMRIFTNPPVEQALHTAKTGHAFLHALESLEVTL